MLAQLFWNAANLWPLAVFAGVALLLLVLVIYPVQLRAINPRWQWVLPLARVMAIVAIVVSILQPTLVRERTQQEHGALIVLLDRSASMGIADSRLTPAQRVALADAVGSLPDGARQAGAPESLRSIRDLRRRVDAAVRAGSDLEYARLTDRQVQRRSEDFEASIAEVAGSADELAKSLVKVALPDAIKSKLQVLQKSPAPAERAAWRKDISELLGPLEQALEQKQAESDAALYAKDAAVRQAADKTAAESRLQLAEQAIVNEKSGLLRQLPPEVPLYGYSFAESTTPMPLRSRGANVRRLFVEADGTQSRIGSAIMASTEAMMSTPVRGVVVFSDGRATAESLAARAGLLEVPVYGVVCGQERSFTDLAIASVEMPASAYAGEDIVIRATIGATNVPAGEYEVTMRCGSYMDKRKVKLATTGSADVEFPFKPEEAGVLPVQLELKAIDGEASTQNNSFSRPVKIIQDRLNVLVVTSAPTWDYQYVRNALTRAKWAKVTDVIVEQGQLSLKPELLAEQDVIVLIEPRVSAFTPQQIDALHRAVTEKGSSVIVTAGTTEQLDAMASNPLMADLLPYRAASSPVWRSWPGDRPAFRVVPAPGTTGIDALRLAEDAQDSEARWGSLPGIYHYLSIPQLKPNVIRNLLVERESQLPVLLESRLGIGRVVFFGVHESWRWRFRVGERDQDRFWQQLIRYSAEEPYAVVSKNMALDLDRVAVRVGENVRVRVRSTSANVKGTPELEVRQDDKLIRIEQLVAVGTLQPGRYAASIGDLPAGSYKVSARLPGDVERLELPLEVRKGMAEELADLSADPSTMAQLAAATGGAAVRLDQVGELHRQLAQLEHRSGSIVEIPLWTSGYTFLFILACLSVEWGVRKVAGLA